MNIIRHLVCTVFTVIVLTSDRFNVSSVTIARTPIASTTVNTKTTRELPPLTLYPTEDTIPFITQTIPIVTQTLPFVTGTVHLFEHWVTETFHFVTQTFPFVTQMMTFATETIPFVLQTTPLPQIQLLTTQKTDPPNIVLKGALVTPQPNAIVTPDTDDETVKTNLQVYGNLKFADPVYKYVVPIILVICLLTMFVFIFVLGKKLYKASSEMSKASCLLLIIVAVADVLTMGFALTEISYLYAKTDNNYGFLPFDSCKVNIILERISAIPHAASTWFTVILAIQRYLCVSRPFSAGNYISLKSSCAYVLIVSVLTISLHVYRFFDTTFEEITVQVTSDLGNITTKTCEAKPAKWVTDPILYESLFAWIRIGVTQFIPCILIVCFVFLMIKSLKHSTQMTKRMKLADSKSSYRNHLSVFVVIVAVIVFCIEVSAGIFLAFNAWEISTGQEVFSYETLKTASIAFDLLLYISYFVIFLIYCLMSKDFRKTMMSVCSAINCRKLKYRCLARKGSVCMKSKTSSKMAQDVLALTTVKSSTSTFYTDVDLQSINAVTNT